MIPSSVNLILKGEVIYGSEDGKYHFFKLSSGSFFGE